MDDYLNNVKNLSQFDKLISNESKVVKSADGRFKLKFKEEEHDIEDLYLKAHELYEKDLQSVEGIKPEKDRIDILNNNVSDKLKELNNKMSEVAKEQRLIPEQEDATKASGARKLVKGAKGAKDARIRNIFIAEMIKKFKVDEDTALRLYLNVNQSQMTIKEITDDLTIYGLNNKKDEDKIDELCEHIMGIGDKKDRLLLNEDGKGMHIPTTFHDLAKVARPRLEAEKREKEQAKQEMLSIFLERRFGLDGERAKDVYKLVNEGKTIGEIIENLHIENANIYGDFFNYLKRIGNSDQTLVIQIDGALKANPKLREFKP